MNKNAIDAYQKNKLNSQIFADKKPKLADYHGSTVYFVKPEFVKDGYSFLDVGGGGGDFAYAISEEVAKIKPTIIDPDVSCIELGKKNYPSFNFIHGFFPEGMENSTERYDIVSMQALFPHLPNWKETLLELRKYSKRYLNISLIFRLSGSTVVDKDISYFYYLDSGVRVHQVIHNIYEFTNFLCIHEMGVKKISFYGYRTPKAGHNFRCVPNSEQIKGNILIEFFQDHEEKPARMGGALNREVQSGYNFFIPEMNYVIDGKEFDVRN